MYIQILINAKLKTGKRSQETEVTGRSQLRRWRSALVMDGSPLNSRAIPEGQNRLIHKNITQITEFQNIGLGIHIWTRWTSPYIERREHALFKPCQISQCNLVEIVHWEFISKRSKQRLLSTIYSNVRDVGNIAPQQQPHNFHWRNHIQNEYLPQHTTM